MDRAERIRRRLAEGLDCERIEVVDRSHLHAGHLGAAPGGQTHYAVTVVAASFRGLSRVDRQRAVNQLVQDEFSTGLHALELVTRTPEEERARG